MQPCLIESKPIDARQNLTRGEPAITMIRACGIVNSVDAAIVFYTRLLDFTVEVHLGSGFAILAQGSSAACSTRAVVVRRLIVRKTLRCRVLRAV